MKTLDEISDSELEDCFNGSTNVDMVRKLLKDCQNPDGWIDTDDFGDEFAYALENFIDAEEDSWEWEEAWFNNRDWGMAIANKVNTLLGFDEKLIN